MAAPGEGNQPSDEGTPQPVVQPQQPESRVARRRLSQARHRATLAGLFNNLRKTVYSQSDLTASKWQVLNKTKIHIQELEQTLDNLLKLKGSFNLEDGNASSLEEVKEEYAKMYSDNDSFPQNSSLPWYLNFYKQTMDLLTMNSIISPQEATLPIVSAAISHLWQTLSEEKKASLLQVWEQQNSSFSDLTQACLELACVEGSVKDSGVDSQGASCSLESTPEEILFEDAFDVASFLDKSEAQHMSNISSVFPNCSSENTEEKFQLYIQIVDFLKGLCCVNTPLNQEPEPPVDDDMLLLRCLETFDDEDL
ncbi:stimulated by retinoic acid gene 8 protein homolog isoform X2 [Psammomys obesus]|uniref:stimulated by retinoic acid gene 8 protein homolog isoform X2 n=1 Tax=Psammomys obesus TaxID=48139 RepID=UPI000B4F86F1|nr:stimulated by retinoic acid gene 8 protein homolog [Meriones unguiculatus]XP_055458139.1 stimulated by retinoic acid gene 8 protein homolog isoform X2 [Psammomys obesus]